MVLLRLTWAACDGSQRPVRVVSTGGKRGRRGSCWCWRTIWVPFLHVAHSAGTVPGRGKHASVLVRAAIFTSAELAPESQKSSDRRNVVRGGPPRCAGDTANTSEQYLHFTMKTDFQVRAASEC